MYDLNDKSALVTGASGGIGSAIARKLHAAGAKVALSGTRQEPLESLANDLGAVQDFVRRNSRAVTENV